jgi:hypothetical protein
LDSIEAERGELLWLARAGGHQVVMILFQKVCSRKEIPFPMDEECGP